MDAYERTLSPFGRFVYRTEQRIRHYELRAKLAEAKTRAQASKAKVVRKGRSRRPGRAERVSAQSRAQARDPRAPGSRIFRSREIPG